MIPDEHWVSLGKGKPDERDTEAYMQREMVEGTERRRLHAVNVSGRQTVL